MRGTMQLQLASAMGYLRWRRLLKNIVIATLLAITVIIPTANSTPPEALRVQLRWLPQAQFAGFYVARDNEIFRKNGLDVTIEPGGPTVNGLQRLLDGEVDVAVAWSSDALDLRRQGGDVVNIGQLLQQPGTMLICNSTPALPEQKSDWKTSRHMENRRSVRCRTLAQESWSGTA